jgi:hypothetical protein
MGSSFWPGLVPNRPVIVVQTLAAGGLPGPIANTSLEAREGPILSAGMLKWWNDKAESLGVSRLLDGD